MASTVAKLFKGEPSPRDAPGHAARTALAEAIAAHAEAEAQCVASAAASHPASEAVWAAQRAVDEATAALAQAKTDAAQHLQDVARGTAGEPPRSIRDARAALLDAEDGLQAARDARDGLKVRMPEEETRRERTKHRLRDAALAVLRAEAGSVAAALVEDLARAQQDVATKGAALHWLVKEGVVEAVDVPEPGQENVNPAYRRVMAEPAKLALARYRSPPQTWNGLTAEGAAPWQAALDALQRDANAPVPT